MSLDEFEANLNQHLQYVRESARDPAAWERARAHYGVPAGIAPVIGKAPAAQVKAVLQKVVVSAATHLESIQAHEDPARVDALWTRLGRIVDEEMKAYAAPSAGAGLGSIFQNATANVGKEPWAGMKWDEQIVLLCKSCGASQQKTRDFKCTFCSGDLFRRPGT